MQSRKVLFVPDTHVPYHHGGAWALVFGHTHRLAVAYEGNAKGETHVGANFGWLGDVERIDYMHKVKARRAWHLGFGIGRMLEDGVVHLQAVPIINGTCIVEGRCFSLS